MQNLETRASKYVEEKLSKFEDLKDYINESSILLNEYENGEIWDIMILLDDDLFRFEFSSLYSDCHIINDCEYDNIPTIFSRVKSYEWFKNDFTKRLPIALWIFNKAIIVKDEGDNAREIIMLNKELFLKNCFEFLKYKYLELRSERHNLRYSIKRKGDIASIILKSNIVKLAFEICFLSEKKPYPFKMLLPATAIQETEYGLNIHKISNDIFNMEDSETVINLTDLLIEEINKFLQNKNIFDKDFLQRWWLYLS